ncbi:TetR/AcrR family transcriptional regulator [Clostridium sp. WILCCON 0269]|uniref:TetR/AcrR family transcriptional regulator n=1 Tax=Candidatus Clostridium eludens TaxID=3381663 RepID=A0ABW8SQ24_9CLOT
MKREMKKNQMKHNPEITAQTRKNLMDAFWDLYSKEGIKKISVREIVGRAGYNRSTFYKYFTDVNDVLEQIEASVLPDLKKHQDIMISPGIHSPLSHITEVYSRNKKYYIVLLGKNGDPAYQEKIKNAFKTLARPHLQSLCADGFILECTLEYTISAILGVMTYCFTQEENSNIEKMGQLLWGLMNDGVMKNLTGTLQSNSDLGKENFKARQLREEGTKNRE